MEMQEEFFLVLDNFFAKKKLGHIIVLLYMYYFYLILALFIHRKDRISIEKNAIQNNLNAVFKSFWKGVEFRITQPPYKNTDPATQALLNRGTSLTQYASLPIEKQILVIYAAVNGFCDRMPLDKIAQYERDILSTIKPELLQSLKGILTSERKIEPDAFLKEKANSDI